MVTAAMKLKDTYAFLLSHIHITHDIVKYIMCPLNIQKTKIMASGPITSWEIDGETVDTVADYFSGLQNHCR